MLLLCTRIISCLGFDTYAPFAYRRRLWIALATLYAIASTSTLLPTLATLMVTLTPPPPATICCDSLLLKIRDPLGSATISGPVSPTHVKPPRKLRVPMALVTPVPPVPPVTILTNAPHPGNDGMLGHFSLGTNDDQPGNEVTPHRNLLTNDDQPGNETDGQLSLDTHVLQPGKATLGHFRSSTHVSHPSKATLGHFRSEIHVSQPWHCARFCR